MAGALVMAITASQATADAPASVALMSSGTALQPVIDQILAQEQTAVQVDQALPFASPTSDPMLPAGVQGMEFYNLMELLSRASVNAPFLNQIVEMTLGNSTNWRPEFGLWTLDQIYDQIQLDPGATYEINITLGAGTGDLTTNATESTLSSLIAGANLELDHELVANPNGTFTVYIGPTEPSGAVNYLDNTGTNAIYIRDTLNSWALGPGSVNIECVTDCPAEIPGVTDTGLSSDMISSLLKSLASTTASSNTFWMNTVAAPVARLPHNEFSPIFNEASNANGGQAAVPSQFGATGIYDLQPGQAMIVKVPDPPVAYSSAELANMYSQTLPSVLVQSSLNNAQAFHDPDGYTYYVISATNPGVANWLDTNGVDVGEAFFRFQNVAAGADGADIAGLPVTGEVVPVADVSQYLPADTPTVSPEEFAADMNERVLSHNFTLDTTRTSDWVTQELWLHDIQQAMGSDNFDAVFGTEPSTPMWLRLTPALSPDLSALAKDMLANPSASLAAIQNTLPLAEKDISLPIQLAQTLLQQDFTQTAQAVQSDLSAGDLTQALAALQAGGQQLDSIINGALFDPNTSIAAGVLNARDDLANAIMTATGGYPSQAGPLATLEWQLMPQLTQLGPGTTPAELSSLLQTAGSDLSSSLHAGSAAGGLGSLLDPTAWAAGLSSLVNPAELLGT